MPPLSLTPSAYPDQKWNGRERHFDPHNLAYPIDVLVDEDMPDARLVAAHLTRESAEDTAVGAPVEVDVESTPVTVGRSGQATLQTVAAYATQHSTGQTTAPPKWDANQGNSASCTAFSDLLALVWGGKHPRLLKVLLSPEGHDFGLSLYRFIQSIDREQGRDYGLDGGATMNASAAALKRLGWISAYYWSYEYAGFIAAQRAKLTTILGIDWPEGYDDPDPVFGVMRFTGDVLGGHSIFVPYSTRDERVNHFAQTWGRANFGLNGIGRSPAKDTARAIAQYGEVMAIVEVPDADPQALISLKV